MALHSEVAVVGWAVESTAHPVIGVTWLTRTQRIHTSASHFSLGLLSMPASGGLRAFPSDPVGPLPSPISHACSFRGFRHTVHPDTS